MKPAHVECTVIIDPRVGKVRCEVNGSDIFLCGNKLPDIAFIGKHTEGYGNQVATFAVTAVIGDTAEQPKRLDE